jgi:hypothetical protein
MAAQSARLMRAEVSTPRRFSTAKATNQMGSVAVLGVWYAVEFASRG